MSPTPGFSLHTRDDGHGKPRHAHKAAFVISNVRLPHVRAAANMQRLCPADNVPALHGADVIGVDLEADGRRAGIRKRQVSRHAPKRLGKHHRCAAMQKTHGLARPIVNRHRRLDPIWPEARYLDTEVFTHVTLH